MSQLTKQEKIDLAKAEISQAEAMIKHSREQLKHWIDTLEVRQEYLATLNSKGRNDD